MSFDYFVFVRREKWPTFAAVQAALQAIGAPVELERKTDEPFAVADDAVGIPAAFEGRQVLIEAITELVTEVTDPASLFGDIANVVSLNFPIVDGDYALTLTFRSDIDETRAGLYVGAAIILSFDGYGFENQFESYGGPSFAKRMLAEASDASAWED